MNLSGARQRDRPGRPSRLADLALLLSLVLLASALSGSLSAGAQTSTTGAIRGRIVDLLGRPVSGASVTITNTAQSQQVVLDATSTGDFFAAALTPAEYAVDIQAPLYLPIHLGKILVEVGGTAHVGATAVPGGGHAEITVTADPTSDIDEPSTSTSSAVSAREISRLPVDGRRWQTLALLTSEVNPGSDSDDLGLLSFRGVAPTQNSSRVDGADDDQSFNSAPHGSGTDADADAGADSEGSTGTSFPSGSGAGPRPGAAYTFSQAAVREFRVVDQNYSALYGHAAGGIVATISKSGTDDLHGSAFYLLRESAWAATNPFSVASHYANGLVSSAVVKPDDHRQQFGGTIGGPIVPHRIFYFYAFDAQRRSFPAISSPQNPAFYSLSATQRALLGNRGVTSQKIDAALSYLDSLTGPVPRRADQTVNFLKLEDQLTPRHLLSLQGNRARFSSPAGIRSAAVVSRGIRSFGSQNINNDSVLARWLYSRNSSFSSEMRVQYSRDLHYDEAQTPLPQEPGIANGGLAPEINISPQGFSFGTPASIGKRAAPDEHRVQFAATGTLLHAQHLIQTGFDYSYVRDVTDSLANTSGTFNYDSGTTGGHAGGLVDWITDYTFNVNTYPNGGCPSINAPIHDFCFRSFSQSFGQQTAHFATQEFAGFLQDRWRPTETLSLTAGVRYEYELLPLPQQPNAALDQVFSARGASGIFPEDRNNLGPRAAAAWQPFGQRGGTVRLAYGLYFGRVPGATIRSALVDTATSSSATRIRILPTTVTDCPQVANQGFGYPCTYTSAPPSGVATSTSVTVFDRRFRLPMLQQGSFAVERSLGHVATLSASYLLNLDRQLPNSVDINIAPATGTRVFQLHGGTGTIGVRDGDMFVLPVYTERVDSKFGPVTAITSNANASYNALVIEAHHRSSDGLEFRTSWTWSKSIDFGQNTGSVPRTNSQLDPFDVRYDKSLSALNFSHKIVASAAWQPKPAFAQPFAQHLAAGWIVAPLFEETSGRPYSYNIFGGTRLTGGHESINGSGGDLYLPTVGRNTLRLPDTFHLDLRVARDLPLSEKVHLSAFVEAFNLTNHRNVASATERAFLAGTASNGLTPLVFQDAPTILAEGLNTQAFGTLTSSSGQSARERQLQLGLRLDF